MLVVKGILDFSTKANDLSISQQLEPLIHPSSADFLGFISLFLKEKNAKDR